MSIDRHTVALISILGSSLDVLGSMYLAYDLLGGEHGPLRTLTRAVTYGVLFGTSYGLAFGPVFGLATGVTQGITFGWEFSRASRHEAEQTLWQDSAVSAIRGLGFALGAAYLYGWTFGLTFGALGTAGQIVAYQAGIRPTMDYRPSNRPRVTRKQLIGVVNRAVGYGLAAYVSALVAHERAIALNVGLRMGLLLGIVTAVFGSFTPLVEWGADRIPEKRMGSFGVILILFGFALQSVQYWLVLIDITIRN
jgi:hypothetical protein